MPVKIRITTVFGRPVGDRQVDKHRRKKPTNKRKPSGTSQELDTECLAVTTPLHPDRTPIPAASVPSNRKQREKKEASKKAKAEVPAITLEMVMRENPGISIPDAFQKLEALRAQEEQKKAGVTAAEAAGAPAPAGGAGAGAGGAAAWTLAGGGVGGAAGLPLGGGGVGGEVRL